MSDLLFNDDDKPNKYSHNFAIQILTRMCDKHSPVIAKFPNTKDQYASLIIKVDPKQNEIYIDELTPPEGHKRVINPNQDTDEPFTNFMIIGSDKGIAVSFKTQIYKIEKDMTAYYYISKIPEKIRYHQRRNSFRVSVLDESKKYILLIIDNTQYNAEFVDVSFTGAKIKIKTQQKNLLQEKQKIILNIISINLILPAEVRRIFFDNKITDTNQNNEILEISTLFMPADNTEQRKINAFVSELQRFERRRASREFD